MKLTVILNSRCAGNNHVHATVTARRENDTLIGTYPLVITADELFDADVEDFIRALPVLIRGLIRELGYTRATPLAQIRNAIESKVFSL